MQTFKTAAHGKIQAEVVKFRAAPNLDFFLNQEPSNCSNAEQKRKSPRHWNISERLTGRYITREHPTPEKAIEAGRKFIKERGAPAIAKQITSYLLGPARSIEKTGFMIELGLIIAVLFAAKNEHEPAPKTPQKRSPKP